MLHIKLFQTFQPLVSYLYYRTELSANRREYNAMLECVDTCGTMIRLCDTLKECQNAEERMHYDMARLCLARGYEWYLRRLSKLVRSQEDIILARIKAEHAELNEVNDMVQLKLCLCCRRVFFR